MIIIQIIHKNFYKYKKKCLTQDLVFPTAQRLRLKQIYTNQF